jgi:hypothetical protein
MRQRKETAYPQKGVFVQPRPGETPYATARHALRMTHQGPRVKAWAGQPRLPTPSIMMATGMPKCNKGPLAARHPRLSQVLRCANGRCQSRSRRPDQTQRLINCVFPMTNVLAARPACHHGQGTQLLMFAGVVELSHWRFAFAQ